MNLRQRCQAVFQLGYKVGEQSFRSLAAATKLSKSSVHRLYHRLQRRNQYPESQLWETEAGQQWLRLLVFAAVFVFALEGGIGCERLSEFFHSSRAFIWNNISRSLPMGCLPNGRAANT
jgi:hypothetical protein